MTHTPSDVALTVLDGLVPLHIADLAASPSRLRAARHGLGDHIDTITAAAQHLAEDNYRLTQRARVVRMSTTARRERRQVLHSTARALAILALTAPAGVDFAGRHWCASPGCRAIDRDGHTAGGPAEPPGSVTTVDVAGGLL
jgi:hypothetical protein